MASSDRCELGFVYVMKSAGLYKIGYSTSPKRRHSGISHQSAAPVELVGVIEGTRAHEREWHFHFRDKRKHGEWFALEDADVAHILCESYGTAWLDA